MPATATNRVLEVITQRLCPSQALKTLGDIVNNSNINKSKKTVFKWTM